MNVSVVDIEPLDLRELVQRTAATDDPSAAYVVCSEDGWSSTTHGTIARAALATARNLNDLGVVSGDMVPVLYPAGSDFITAFLACVCLGAVAIPWQPLGTRSPKAHRTLLASVFADCGVGNLLARDAASD